VANEEQQYDDDNRVGILDDDDDNRDYNRFDCCSRWNFCKSFCSSFGVVLHVLYLQQQMTGGVTLLLPKFLTLRWRKK